MSPSALIADDEPHLAEDLRAQLARAWPQLRILALAANGIEALDALDTQRPDIAFLDIRMPGLGGLEVAQRMAAACHVVFVTAYDQYAVAAFEAEAVDYLLKPVTAQRLAQTVARLKARLNGPAADLRGLLEKLAAPQGAARLRWVRATVGAELRLIAVEEVCYFEAADKYTRVVTASGEALIRTPIRELAEQLDPEQFWQVHRGTLVNARRIAAASRDLRGRLVLRLKDVDEALVVSRAYAHLFRQM